MLSPEGGQQLVGAAMQLSMQPLPELPSLGLRALLSLKGRDKSSLGESPGTWPRRKQRPTEGSWSARFPGVCVKGGYSPSSRLLPPPCVLRLLHPLQEAGWAAAPTSLNVPKLPGARVE